ncbi:hypothetical protein CW748_10755 [Alteromonadales bacterium alter-6D02]|nr:hypothetical protein CW748_10755 [Alteromonadales bacterium alter-6D02]
MFLDTQTFIVILGFVYGLSIAVFGWRHTLASISGIKHLFSKQSVKNPELSYIYKTKIKFSFWAGGISLLISIVAIANNLDDLSVLGYALAVALLSLVYPVILSGALYYPLYKKLA